MTPAEITISTIKSLLGPLKGDDLRRAWVRLRGCHSDQPEVLAWLRTYMEKSS
jgi:hypothetical protein